MYKFILQILLFIGAFFMLLHEQVSSPQSGASLSVFDCTTFDIEIQSDTLYDCPGNTHLFPSDTSINYIYQWIGPSSYASSSWEIYVSERGVYGLTVLDTLNNCIATDSIYVRQIPCEDLSSEFIPPGIDITVYLDTVAPTFTVPIDTTLYTSNLCAAQTSSGFTGEVVDAMDTCDPSLEIVFQDSLDAGCTGSITIYRTWTVRDDCNNETSGQQIIHVQDSTPPELVVPSDITIYTDSSCDADTSVQNLGDYISISDNCDNSSIVATHDDVITSLCSGSYEIERTWRASDDCGNTGTATQIITVLDGQDPIIYVPADTVIADGGSPSPATTSDNCTANPILTFSDSTFVQGCNMILHRTWHAEDECGNFTDSVQQVTFTNHPGGLQVDLTITSDYNGNALSCFGTNDGSIFAEVQNGSGPFTYTWSNGSTTDSLSGLGSGVYNLTVSDASGCQIEAYISIPNPLPLQVNVNTTLVNCGASDGTIYVSGQNGSGNYEFSLDSSIWQTTSSFENLAAGSYNVYIRDLDYGCNSDATPTELFTASAPIIDESTIIHPNSPTSNDGAILVSASGVGLAIEYRIPGNTGWQNSGLFEQLGIGEYTVQARYENQTCLDSIQLLLIADGGVVTADSSDQVCSDELSNISQLGVYYLPIGEDEILNALQTITPNGCADRFSVDPIQNYIYVGVVESGTTITFDHWEDGFEPNFDFAIQQSTEVWGDNNPSNGMPPGYNLDILEAGDKIFLNNAVQTTTLQSIIDYDAGDRISSRGSISITRLGWASGSSTLFAGAVEVHERDKWGRNYTLPVGQNTDVNDMFVYTGFSVMASEDNTQVNIDADNNGILDQVITLNEGESYLYNGGANSGGTIDASAPVQVHMITGDDCSNYETRWFTLSPEENWDSGYYVPVSTLNSGAATTMSNNKPTYVHLYNPNTTNLEVVYRTETGIQDTLIVPAGGTAYQEIPEGTGAHFGSDENFYAIATIDSDNGNNTANDWGFALLPERSLTPQIYLTGFAPGQNPEFTCDLGISIPSIGYLPMASSEESNNLDGAIQNAFDGDLTTAWFSEYSSGSPDHPHELIIDLGDVYNIIGFKHINALNSVQTSTYTSPNPPVTIPNNTLYNTSTSFAVTDNFAIIDLNLHIDFDHYNIGDLTLILEGPDGTQTTIFDRQCGNADDILATFDDEAGSPFDCANSNSNNSYTALDLLSIFEGKFTEGVWTLHIEDHNGIIGGGALNNWALTITHGVSDPGSVEDFEFYVSQDGVNWGIPLASGTWADSIPIHDVRMGAIDARYVRFVTLSDHGNLGIASISEFEVLECGSSFEENSSPIWVTAGHSSSWQDTAHITVCVDFNGDGGSVTDPNGATYDSSFVTPPLGLLKIYDPDGDQTGMRIWVCDGSDGIISGAWGQDPAMASPANPAIDLGVGLINSIPFSAQKCVELHSDNAGNGVYDKCDEVTYTIVIRNTGALPLSTGTIEVIDTLPAELEYIVGSSRAEVDGIPIAVADDSLGTTPFPFDENGSAIDTIILPGDSLLIKFEALIAYINFGTFITNEANASSGDNSFDPYVSFPVQEPMNPLDSIVPRDTLVSCEAFEYPDPSIDTLSYLSIHDTILEGACLDAYTFQRIYTVLDNCGQTYIDTMQITVVDTTAPIIQIPADTVISMHDLPFSIVVPGTDNCDSQVDLIVVDDTTFNTCSFVIERVYTAEDNCANISQETLRITVLQESNQWPVDIAANEVAPCHDEIVQLTSNINNFDSLSYEAQWYFRQDSSQAWNEIVGANQSDYSYPASQTNAGFYEVRYTQDANNLDSNCVKHTNQIYIDARPITTTGYINAIICVGDVYLFDDQVLTATGSYVDTVSNNFGCDSIVQLNLIALPPDRETIRDTTCYGYPYSFGGNWYTQAGTYHDTLTNSSGCDSIITLELNVRPELYSSLDIRMCPDEIFNYNGKTFDTSGSYDELFVGSNGCDSVVTLNLVYRRPAESMTQMAVCYGDSVLIGSTYVQTSGTYTESYFTEYGCDSLARYEINVADDPVITNIETAICEGDSLFFDDQYIREEGTYQSNSTSLTGCDSTTILNLSIEPRVQLTAESFQICEGESVTLNVQGADHVNWSNVSGLSCTNCPNPIVSPTMTTEYEAFTSSCLDSEVRVPMVVNVLPVPQLTIDADTSIVLGEAITLRANVDDASAIINWKNSNGQVLCVDCPSVNVTPVATTYYIAETSNNLGCEDRDSVGVLIRDGCIEGELSIPNFISPNGDGDNDYFTIQWAGIKSAEKLKIFNRWGEMVFSTQSVDKVFWDGRINGQLVNPGVYVYYIEYYCLSNELQRHKGNVTVIR